MIEIVDCSEYSTPLPLLNHVLKWQYYHQSYLLFIPINWIQYSISCSTAVCGHSIIIKFACFYCDSRLLWNTLLHLHYNNNYLLRWQYCHQIYLLLLRYCSSEMNTVYSTSNSTTVCDGSIIIKFCLFLLWLFRIQYSTSTIITSWDGSITIKFTCCCCDIAPNGIHYSTTTLITSWDCSITIKVTCFYHDITLIGIQYSNSTAVFVRSSYY